MAVRVAIFRRGQWIYCAHVLSLFLPGHAVPTLAADPALPSSLDGWCEQELDLLIDEGRRQVDRQQNDLQQIRVRAQWLFTVAAGVTAALATSLAKSAPSPAEWTVGILALVLLIYGLGGAAAILTVRADFAQIHTPVLSGSERPIQRSLAAAYSRMMTTGENTIATRLTIFRQAVVLCLIGGYLGLLTALLAASP